MTPASALVDSFAPWRGVACATDAAEGGTPQARSVAEAPPDLRGAPNQRRGASEATPPPFFFLGPWAIVLCLCTSSDKEPAADPRWVLRPPAAVLLYGATHSGASKAVRCVLQRVKQHNVNICVYVRGVRA